MFHGKRHQSTITMTGFVQKISIISWKKHPFEAPKGARLHIKIIKKELRWKEMHSKKFKIWKTLTNLKKAF